MCVVKVLVGSGGDEIKREAEDRGSSEEEAFAINFDVLKMIVSRYVAESITTDCRTYWLHRPLSTAYKRYVQKLHKPVNKFKAYGAETPCNQLLFILYTTYLLTTSTLDINNIAMSLHVINFSKVTLQFLAFAVILGIVL